MTIANGTANNTPMNPNADPKNNAHNKINKGLTQRDLFINNGTSTLFSIC